jgi:hypothetical protein
MVMMMGAENDQLTHLTQIFSQTELVPRVHHGKMSKRLYAVIVFGLSITNQPIS